MATANRLFAILALMAMALSSAAFQAKQPPAQSQVPDEYKKYKEHQFGSNFVNPKMEIVNLGIANLTQEGARLMMGVNVVNPNKDSAKVKDMTYTMTIDGQYLGRGNYSQEFKLEPFNTVNLTLPLDVRFADLPKPQEILALLGKKNVKTECDTYFVASKFGVNRRVHVVYRNEDIVLKILPDGKLPDLTPQMAGKKGVAIIESVWLENPVVSKEGERGVGLHSKFVVEGMLNQECIFAAFFYKADGSKVITTAKDFSTPSGHTTAQRRFTPGFDSTAYDDFSVFVPARALIREPIYVKVQVISPEGVVLETTRQDFTLK
jgi:LEA14-like dessication related protein